MKRQTPQSAGGEILARIIATAVPLVRCGATYLGPCPFDEQEAETFHVDPRAGLFYCSDCSCEGDLVDWFVRFDGCTPEEAKRIAAGLLRAPDARATRAA